MLPPGPFTPAELGAGILANIATDILKHHAQVIENTLAGRMLKLAGLIEPDFDDRLQDTLIEALRVYFETYPQYQLAGIAAFFRDPITAQQVGGYILDRKPIDPGQIQQALNLHLDGDAITTLLIQKQGVKVENIVSDFLICYRQVLNRHLNVPQMAILLEVLEQTNTLVAEVRASEARLKDFVSQLLENNLHNEPSRVASQNGDQRLAEMDRVNQGGKFLQQPVEHTQSEQGLPSPLVRPAATIQDLTSLQASPSALSFDLSSLRQQLNQTFDDTGLDTFCMDNFPDVFDKFSRGLRKDEKINMLLDHCRHVQARYQKLVIALERKTE